jgi:hypothetical protein
VNIGDGADKERQLAFPKRLRLQPKGRRLFSGCGFESQKMMDLEMSDLGTKGSFPHPVNAPLAPALFRLLQVPAHYPW